MEPGANFVSGEKATRKYLAGHAEPETEWAERLGARFPVFGHGVAIPCYAEGSRINECLATIPPGPRGPVLAVVVVNAPAGAEAAEW